MTVVRHHPRSFVERAGPFLERAEAENNLMLGLALGLQAGAMTVSATPVLATVEDGGVIRAAALRTPPHNLIITDASDEATCELVAWLRAGGFALPGVTGPVPAVERFAERWAGAARVLHMSQRLYACSRVANLASASGALRVAREADLERVRGWVVGYQRDTREPEDSAKERVLLERHVADESLFVWDDGALVSMAWVGGPTPRGIRVSGVYTPPELRGRGYSTSCVAALTERMLGTGRHHCCLYADLANPTSNGIYLRIGYQPIGDSAMWRFTQA